MLNLLILEKKHIRIICAIQKILDLNFAIENNGQFRELFKFNKHRDEFFESMYKYKFSKLINIYIKIMF